MQVIYHIGHEILWDRNIMGIKILFDGYLTKRLLGFVNNCKSRCFYLTVILQCGVNILIINNLQKQEYNKKQ